MVNECVDAWIGKAGGCKEYRISKSETNSNVQNRKFETGFFASLKITKADDVAVAATAKQKGGLPGQMAAIMAVEQAD